MKTGKLTALELVNLIETLESVTKDMYQVLLENFPKDSDCGDCTFCEDFIEDCIDIPDWAKEAVGLSPDTKFAIVAEEDSGRILLEPLESEHDLSDISEEMRVKLSDMGVCLGELNESIVYEEIVYGN